MMPWFKFWKWVSTVPKESADKEYFFFEENDLEDDPEAREKQLMARAERWADGRPGGFNRGYKYGVEAEDPPKKWLEQVIKQLERNTESRIEKAAFFRRELLRLHGTVPAIEDAFKTSLTSLMDTLAEVMPSNHSFVLNFGEKKSSIQLQRLGGTKGHPVTLEIYQGRNFTEAVQQALLYYIEGEGKKWTKKRK
jgi:hypothetical protein